MRIPLARPDITEDDVAAVAAVMRSGRLSCGPAVEAFEAAAAAYLGARGAVAVSSGTSGLELCLRALGIGRGDEVVTSSFSFAASATSIVREGAVPVFVDIDPRTLSLDPAEIEAAVTPQTRAIVVVHVFGHAARIPEILEIASRRGLAVIEDACEAFGTSLGGRMAGTFGDAGVFAFYPNKQITTGEGGLVVARDAALEARIRRIRNQGRDPSAGWFQHVELGASVRMSDMHAALGLSQLRRIEAFVARREALAASYGRAIAGVPGFIAPPPLLEGERRSWFAYTVQLAEGRSRADRDQLVARMAGRGIECGRYFAPIHLQPVMRAPGVCRHGPLPRTESAADRSITLPFFHGLTDAEVGEVCASLAEPGPRAQPAP